MPMWNVVQQVQIRSLRKGQLIGDQAAHHEINRQRENVEELQDQLEHLSLVCEAMWLILSERLGVTEQDLIQRLTLAEQSTSAVDMAAAAPGRCSQCGATVPPRAKRCQMCGAAAVGLLPAGPRADGDPPMIPPPPGAPPTRP